MRWPDKRAPTTFVKTNRKRTKERGPSKENVGIQTTPPRAKGENISTMTFSFLNNPDLMTVKGPKTPSPVGKTKVLAEADQLLAVAERELTSVEAKLSSDRLLSAKTSRSELPSARRIMSNVPLSPTRGSVFSNSSLKSRSKTSYCVPQNSPSSLKIHGNEENYKRNNGEKKILSHKHCIQHQDLKPFDDTSTANKSNKDVQSDLRKTPAITEFSMFYEQQQLVERKTQSSKERNSATVIFKSDAKTISSTDVVRQDAQTNTGPVLSNVQSSNLKFTPNSSIISMKTSKPEEEDQPSAFPGKVLNVQKMPSVNIRPGFTVQHGPKINIVGSSSRLYKPRRKNTEFFDVVYPPCSPVFSEASFVSDQGRQNRQLENHAEYICERHTFPSGRLIPGTMGENLRQTNLQNSLSLAEKKEMLIELIKSVTEKVEQQSNRRKMNCCRLVSSLPLLASVVRKIQVDCVKCADSLNTHLDRLIVLMKEELRGYKELSDNQCCQLDDAIHYQIVELELMQEENLKGRTHGNVTVIKHKESEPAVKPPKKSVSFESIPDELAFERKKVITNQTKSKKCVPATSSKMLKTSAHKQPSTPRITINGNENIASKKPSSQKKSLHVVSKKGNSINPTLKKITNLSSEGKEKTVMDQVIKNLSNKKSILKKGAVLTESKSDNLVKNRKSLNAYIKVVDQKESSSEFEKWMKERSLKIQQIHEELNKMVECSMEKYLESRSQRNDGETPTTTSRSEWLTLNENEKQPEEVDKNRTDTQKEENKDEDKNPDSSTQDAVQEYDEDFEEDVEELPNLNSIENNSHLTEPEAENGSTSSSGNEEVYTDEDIGSKEKSFVQKLPNDASTDPVRETSSWEQADEVVLSGKELPAIHISADPSENNEITKKPETVSVATSPINIKPSPQSIDVSVNTSFSYIGSRKESATSPVMLSERSLPKSKSTLVQTESSGVEVENVIPGINNKGQTDLTVPSVRLTPKPIENVFKITLGETKENSMVFHTDSSKQTLQLVVQLPAVEKLNEKKKIIELDCSDESERNIKSGKNKESNTNASTNLKSDDSVDEGKMSHNVLQHNKFNEQTIKDIIEPTVSEVLKKISNDNLPKNTRCQNEDHNKPPLNPNTCSGLVKPNIILQTRHGLWKKCEEDQILNIVDLEQVQKIDSSNQTEAEKQNVCVQVARSVAGSDCEKASSARMFDGMSSRSRGYLEMLLPPPQVACSVPSSHTNSSTCRSSSRSSSTTSSDRKQEILHQVEKLSDGELLPESCNCKVGEVCEICVPRLDLSFGELKTKKRSNRSESDSSSDHLNSRHTSVSLSSLPLNLEPRPPPARKNPMSAPSLTKAGPHFRSDEAVSNSERKPNLKQFSELAKSVLSDLGKELKTFGNDQSRYVFPKPPSTLQTISSLAASNALDTSSSGSSKSQRDVRTKKSSSKHGTKQRASLVIRTPVDTPRIDVVIEDPEVSSSSYQTSVTSVSVDQLPEALSSRSSADASS